MLGLIHTLTARDDLAKTNVVNLFQYKCHRWKSIFVHQLIWKPSIGNMKLMSSVLIIDELFSLNLLKRNTADMNCNCRTGMFNSKFYKMFKRLKH